MVVRRLWLFALLTGLAFSSLAHAPQADAQYPGGGGGGGYPGGGNNYPGAGWHPLIPPAPPSTIPTPGSDPLNNSVTFYKYDWTKLDDIDPTGVPGPGDFPMPPLFVIGSITPNATLYYTAGGDVNPTGTGYISDGWGWGPVNIELPPLHNPSSVSDGVHRKILAATVESAMVQSVTMSPSGHVELSLAKPGYGQSVGTAAGFLGMSEYAYPLSLTGPNPLTNPQLGDGTNQYVYDNIIPNTVGDQGHLFVDGTILVSGAGTDDLNWLLTPSPKVDCAFDPGLTQTSWMVNPANYKWAVSPVAGSSLQVMTSNATDWRIQETFPYYDFVFFQLPVADTGFGNHTETLTVNGSPSQVANIQTFFLGKASNYPSAYDDYENSNANVSLRFRKPNWYYYYNQPNPATVPYTPITTQWQGSYCDPNTKGHEIYIKDDAFASGATHVFSVDTNNPSSYVKYAGRLGISGIFQYIDVCAHEKGHQDAWKPQPAPDTVIYTSSTANDVNHDGIDDNWERAHHFRIDRKDTTGAYTANELGNDIANQEVIADIPAIGAILANTASWASDWAGAGPLADGTQSIGGVQWARPALAVRPGDTKLSYYFLFYPVTSGTPDTGFTVSSKGYLSGVSLIFKV